MAEQTKTQPKRSHLTPEQEAAFTQLRNILDPENQTYNPVSRRGAQIMQERGQTVKHWQTPLNVLGLTFHDDYLPQAGVESNMLREAELSPTSARGQIAVGPEFMTGKRPDTLPHELAHLAILADGVATGGIDEAIIRQLMIQDGIAVKENMEFLSATIRTDAMDVVEGLARSASKQSATKLKGK